MYTIIIMIIIISIINVMPSRPLVNVHSVQIDVTACLF